MKSVSACENLTVHSNSNDREKNQTVIEKIKVSPLKEIIPPVEAGCFTMSTKKNAAEILLAQKQEGLRKTFSTSFKKKNFKLPPNIARNRTKIQE